MHQSTTESFLTLNSSAARELHAPRPGQRGDGRARDDGARVSVVAEIVSHGKLQ